MKFLVFEGRDSVTNAKMIVFVGVAHQTEDLVCARVFLSISGTDGTPGAGTAAWSSVSAPRGRRRATSTPCAVSAPPAQPVACAALPCDSPCICPALTRGLCADFEGGLSQRNLFQQSQQRSAQEKDDHAEVPAPMNSIQRAMHLRSFSGHNLQNQSFAPSSAVRTPVTSTSTVSTMKRMFSTTIGINPNQHHGTAIVVMPPAQERILDGEVDKVRNCPCTQGGVQIRERGRMGLIYPHSPPMQTHIAHALDGLSAFVQMNGRPDDLT